MAKVLDKGNIFSPEDTLSFLDKVLQGLEACWEKRIVHRDIKPANIMLRTNGSPVIVDFGLSRHLELTSLTPTEYPGAIGTLLFAPPELLSYTKNDIDSKTDLYSLGITVYMMMTGQHPYINLRNPPKNVMYALMNTAAIAPHLLNPAIPESLSRFVLRLMKRNRVDRPRDAAQARSKLSELS